MPGYLFDGMNLDHAAGCWRIENSTGLRTVAGRDRSDFVLPGRHGVISPKDDPFEPGLMGVTLMVTDISPAGAAGGMAQREANLTALLGVLGQRGNRELQDTTVTPTRTATARVLGEIKPERYGHTDAVLPIIFEVPHGFWRDVDTAEWTQVLSGTSFTAARVTTLDGSSAPVVDALLRLKGPVNTIKIADDQSDTFLEWSLVGGAPSLPSTKWLLIDCNTWRAIEVSTATWSDAGGVDRTGGLSSGGLGSYLLPLTPKPQSGDPFDRRVTLTASYTSTTGASELRILARRSFL